MDPGCHCDNTVMSHPGGLWTRPAPTTFPEHQRRPTAHCTIHTAILLCGTRIHKHQSPFLAHKHSERKIHTVNGTLEHLSCGCWLYWLTFHTIYICVNIPVVVKMCGTGPCTLSQQHRLRVFKNRKTLGTKLEQVRGEWRKVHGEELHGLYSSPER